MARSKAAKFVERERVPDDVKIEVELLLSPSPAGRREELMRKLAERYYELEPATRVEFARKHLFRASQELLDKVKKFALRNGLTIVDSTGVSKEGDELPSRVTLRGSVGQMTRAFNFKLHWFSAGPSRYMAPANASEPLLPPGIAEHVVAILGLDRRPVIFPLKQPVDLPEDDRADAKLLPAPPPGSAPITALELAKLYNFPPGQDGSGQKIGVILSYGGLHQSAFDTYLQCLKSQFPSLKSPTVTITALQGAKNNPSPLGEILDFLRRSKLGSNPPLLPCSALGTSPVLQKPSPSSGQPDNRMAFTLEAMLDTELLGSVANGAELRVYITPNDILGIKGAIERAGTDGVDVLVLPWGFAEGTPGTHYITSIDWALSYAVLDRDMTILCASGDYGSTPSRFDENKVEAVYPASSIWVVACGGTTLQAPSPSGTFSEVVWNEQNIPTFGHLATGGGFSGVIDRPAWQTGNSEPKRGVPDLSISAAFSTGLWVWFGSANGVALGTSASVAILGGLVALINQGLGRRAGLLTPLLYDAQVRATMRRLSQQGDNSIRGSVTQHLANPLMIWNPCTGLGSPDGVQLLSSIQALIPELQKVVGLNAAEALLGVA